MGEWNLRQFWNITSGIDVKYHIQIMLLFVYTTTDKRFVIFTCRYFKLSWNTTALSQSNCSNFLCSSIKTKIMDMLVEFQVWEIMTEDTQCQFYLNRWPNKIVESSLPYCLKDFCSKQGELKKKAVYNPTKGTLLLRLNRENGWGKYEIEPKNSGCFWTLFFTWYRLDGDRVLHTLWPKI